MMKHDTAFDVEVPIVSNAGMRFSKQFLQQQLAVLDGLSA